MKSVEPCVFGPIFWTIFHLISFSYDPQEDQDKQNMKNFILSSGSILPCEACRQHFNENINKPINGQTLDSALNSSVSFQKYLYDFHNLVNLQTGKSPSTWPSFNDIKNIYEPLINKGSCSIDSCHSDSNDVYCKIEFYKKDLLNGSLFMGYIPYIIAFILIIGLIYYNMSMSKRKR